MSTGPGGARGMRRRAAAATELVRTGFLPGNEQRMPLVISPAVANVDLAGWCSEHRAQIDGHLDRYGCVLFRGFELHEAEDFEAVAGAIAGELFAEYGDLPPESASARVYGSTPYPPDKMILFHNESSHLATWPLRQFFFCVTPAAERGQTPVLDCRQVLAALDPEVRERFAQRGLLYVRNFAEGVDVPWQSFFGTDDRDEVQRTCAQAGMTCEWKDNNGLRITQRAEAVRIHPRTGEAVFFNQVQLHHPSCLDEETRVALRRLFDDADLPRSVYFGDGTPIPDETVAALGELFERLCVEFTWQIGDLLAVDNMLVAHARRPYSGPRKQLVAMGQMVDAGDLAAAAS